MRTRSVAAQALLAGALAAACAADDTPERPPNVLWIVWDTVRADRLSLYGHTRETTPFLDRWAGDARTFEDALSASCWTVPSHASFFTGLYPSEHGADNAHSRLDERNVTIAEMLRDAGYRTYLFSSNPHVSAIDRFDQGFETAEHPWDKRFRPRVMEIMARKTAREADGELVGRMRRGELNVWDVKPAGELAQGALLEWLDAAESDRPWFAFLNYMEAHRPLVPPEELRARFLDPADVERSLAMDKGLDATWSYVFREREMDEDERRVLAGTYDAALLELDGHLESLIGALEAAGRLEDTVVILTADHGEHLGEHHLVEHQFSLYQDLVRVPLVLHAPGRVAAGREPRPVMTLDLVPTLLELTDTPPPANVELRGRSLLDPDAERVRLAEFLVPRAPLLARFAREHPGWSPTPWQRSLRALWDGDQKLIWSSDGRHELYDLARDPAELHDRFGEDPTATERLQTGLDVRVADLRVPTEREPVAPLTPERRRQLEALGYVQADEP